MNSNKFWAAVSKTLTAVIVTLVAILLLATSAGAASKYKTLDRFTGGNDGGGPYAGMIFDQSGNLYGTTGGGAYGGGTVFKLSPNTDGSWNEKVLHQFTGGKDGGNPDAGLIFDQAGNLYGTTYFGGAYSNGTVFKLTPNEDGSWTEIVLYSFKDTDGAYPQASLIFGQAGDLYGATAGGGHCGKGTVIRLTPNQDGSWTESVLYSFTGGNDGASPWAEPLIFDQSGNLYGVTYQGGNRSQCTFGCGVVFQVSPKPNGSWKEKVLHHFTGGKDGGGPASGLIFDAAGTLYGTTDFGGAYGKGVVFKLTPNPDGSWNEKVLHHFTRGKDGANPFAGLIFDQAGNLYGTAMKGGNLSYCGDGCGVVFKLTLGSDGTWRERVLHSFMAHPGAYPWARVIFDAAGNLYGTTYGDGTTVHGSVFEITP